MFCTDLEVSWAGLEAHSGLGWPDLYTKGQHRDWERVVGRHLEGRDGFFCFCFGREGKTGVASSLGEGRTGYSAETEF